ncbi:acyltransferase [Marinagarivorans algicola]|uniref:acyltransferase n=1 Tax=Marinagarivorans algicola TaxID=1513270 RepID=UPI0009E8D585|nr:DapH/DapD/GlmU-related protein [Marinagarivorans algicola]
MVLRIFFKALHSVLSRIVCLSDIVRYKYYGKCSEYYFDSQDFFRGRFTHVYGGGTLYVGANSYCGSNCGFQSAPGRHISIGERTAISHNVRVYTSNRDPLDIIGSKQSVEVDEGDVSIGKGCWIGANVIVLQGVSIGNHSVIGANSVVTKNIPANVVAAGAPIKIVRTHLSND